MYLGAYYNGSEFYGGETLDDVGAKRRRNWYKVTIQASGFSL